MTTTELLVFFAVAMLAIAVLAIAVDWVAKPIRRRFIPKMYRFPEELGRQAPPPDPSLTGWSDQYFVIPDELVSTNGHVLDWPNLEAIELDDDGVEPPGVAYDSDDVPFDYVHEHGDGEDGGGLPHRALGWQRGQYVYNLIGNGSEPSVEIVRTRFWKNVSSTEHAGVFGAHNVARMSRGRPPKRRNPRTGRDESMQLVVEGYLEAQGRPPRPRWPDDEVDPFAVT